MSQGNRRMSQIPMRKSHSNASLDGSNFQNSSQMQAMNPNGNSLNQTLQQQINL
jgi:hypothetical protein